MNLVIDIGNSIAKLAVFQQDKILKKIPIGKSGLKKSIAETLQLHPEIKNVVVSNVSSAEWELPMEVRNQVKVVELSVSTLLPFKNSYGTPKTLGNDRRALMAAAVKHHAGKDVLVVDAGTCITYDFKTAEDEYLGGGISPGLKMRFLALHNFTANLPLVEAGEVHELIGTSTTSSITSGVMNGTVMEIDGIINGYKEKYPNLICIITGGDATSLSGNLKNGIFANSNFLLEGLNYILEFNIDQ
ncbi:type III pantothenate kinase [Salinimicrobium terrae]|uniref:type III pantothenate kinase n=1 Tax=Salinimicrobium terrae TaxID=470866 RepID=UPI00048CF4C4|nr:type III pantothenate kinase [Salinimicrobium terrae]